MWSPLAFFLIVGVAFASSGWKDNTEYVYEIRGRTLAALHEVADQYSGIVLNAKLIVRPRADGHLSAKISDARYAQVHANLPEGWNSYISESQLSFKELPITGKPFQIIMEQNVVRDLVVDHQVSEWEANIIKSIVSQMQLDTQGKNLIQSRINVLPTEDSNNAVFKTLEDTVTGITETLYEIHPLPEYVLESKPWLAPFPHLKGQDGQIIEIVKSKNFTHSEERPSYYFGLSGMGQWEPATNQLGEFFTRTSVGHAIITGSLKRYTLQHSSTVSKIIVSPTLNDKQKGSVISMLNMTLAKTQSSSEQFEELQQPISLGNLVYKYSQQTSENKVRPGKQAQYEEHMYDYSEERLNSPALGRFRRSLNQQESEDSSIASDEQWRQEQRKLSDAPNAPFMPYTMGYKGMPVKYSDKVQIVAAVQKLAREIGQDLESLENIPRKNTLSKFVLLKSLIQSMDEKELKEVARDLYTKEEQGNKRASWVAFRDAVADSGTGPAFLTIMEWIETQKIQHHEAAEIIETMMQSVHQPTEEYIRKLFTLITKREVMNQHILNETALLSFSELVRKVYVDREVSHHEYPVHTFGKYNTESGRAFLKSEYWPYLTKQLTQAIEQGNTRHIHVYIRAFGNVGSQEILSVFKPFLEGKKQCSQFQRLLMVISMDQLVKVEPKIARSVLYKIYQNAGETPEIRSAAVYQLMRTSPPTDMLQRMAEYTHQDPSEYVSAAVKSSIESAAKLEGEEFQYLRSSAQAAQPLLTKKQFGVQYSADLLRSYVVREMKLNYKQSFQTLVNEEHVLPNALRYTLRAKFGRFNRQLIDVQGMVSSIDELVNVWERQSTYYKQQQQEQESDNSKWSSRNIARLLNLKVDEREQLEGNMYLRIGEVHRFFSFDNHSVELVPELLRELEETLRSGKTFRYTKLSNNGEFTIAFPTETGFPFLYTYDMPTLVTVEGKISAESKPQLVSGEKWTIPEMIKSHVELKAIVSSKVHTKIGFVTPFDHQEYSAGYDKNVQFHIPLRTTINVDLKNKNVQAEFQALEPKNTHHLFHYSSWPYTSRRDILDLKPIAGNQNTQIITKKDQEHKMDHVFGQKSTGLAFRVRYESDNKMDLARLVEKIQRQDAISTLMTPWIEETIQHTEVDVEYKGEISTTHKVNVRLQGKHQEHEHEYKDESNDSTSIEAVELFNMPAKSSDRMEQMLKKSSAGIRSVESRAYDAVIEFEGQQKVKVVATAAIAKSDVDSKSRVLFYLKKESQISQEKPYFIVFVGKSFIPNTNGLNFAQALEMEPTITSQIKLAYGQDANSAAKFNGHLKMVKSEERKQYIMELPMYQQCRREMEQGNYQLPACANMTQESNLLDRVQMEVQFENLEKKSIERSEQFLNAIRYWTRLHLHETIKTGHGQQQNLKLEARFARNLRQVDVTVEGEHKKFEYTNLPVGQWAQRVVVVHPVFHVRSRLAGKAFGLTTYRPICVVDKNAALTFDNKTYPVELNNIWTVMLQYINRQARHHQEEYSAEKILKRQLENYVVLVRKSETEGKEVKITVAVPETQGKLIDITLKPTEGKQIPRVFVDGQQIQVSESTIHQIKNGLVKIYALPTGEVKVEVRSAFYVIFDGQRVKLTTLSQKFRGSIRGLCGTFSGEQTTDFLTSNNCIVRDPREFVASYSIIEEGSHNQEISTLKNRLEKPNHCVYKNMPLYATVISERDAGRDTKYQHHEGRRSNSCTVQKTRYVMENGQVCFTLRPMPVCKSGCQQRGQIFKNVEVHCVDKSNASDLWKSQIDLGANPDFSLKVPSKTIRMELPQTCSK